MRIPRVVRQSYVCWANHPTTHEMTKDRAIFQDPRGRSWLVEVLYGHPAPTERGIYAARFQCPEDEAEPVRVGFVELDAVANDDAELLLEALEMADPAEAIG
jgi:hypothetical protein